MSRLIVLVSILVCSCNFGPWKKDNEPKPTKSGLEQIKETERIYRSLRPDVADETGAIGGICDSRLFTGLGVAFGEYNFDMAAYEMEPGKHGRHPTINCYTMFGDDGNPMSDSECSRDMEMGHLHAWWTQRNDPKTLIQLEEKIAYLKSHNFILCDGAISATQGLTLMPLYLKMREKISGVHEEPPEAALALTEKESGDLLPQGFEANLRVLRIHLNGRMEGAIDDLDLETLQGIAEENPNNAQFQAAYHLYSDGNQSTAISLLNQNVTFPWDRLPTSSDHCEMYLYQRKEAPKDWGPCPDEGNSSCG